MLQSLNAISDQSLISQCPDQVATELQGEVVILNLKTGSYFGLNEVGSSIWRLIQSPQSVEAIRQGLLDEYEVDREQCDRDLKALLHELANAELIQISHAQHP